MYIVGLYLSIVGLYVFSVPQTLYDEEQRIQLLLWYSYFLFKHEIMYKLSVETEYFITPVNKSFFEILNRHSTDLIRKFIFNYQLPYHIYGNLSVEFQFRSID